MTASVEAAPLRRPVLGCGLIGAFCLLAVGTAWADESKPFDRGDLIVPPNIEQAPQSLLSKPTLVPERAAPSVTTQPLEPAEAPEPQAVTPAQALKSPLVFTPQQVPTPHALTLETPQVRPQSAQPQPEAQAAVASEDDKVLLRQLMADETLVARVDGRGISWGEVWRSAEKLPPDYQDKLDVIFPALLQRAVDLQLLAAAARAQGLPGDPAIQREVADFEDSLIRERLLESLIAAQVTEPLLRQLYDDYLSQHAAAVEVTARHIQLDDRKTALQMISALDGGADFATLAQQYSVAGSGAQGGSLGTFRLGRMPPSFASAVIALAPGQYTREPVPTEFGWHVILLEQKPDMSVASFAEMEPRLRQEATRGVINDLLRDLRARAEIEILPVEPAAGEDSRAAGSVTTSGDAQ